MESNIAPASDELLDQVRDQLAIYRQACDAPGRPTAKAMAAELTLTRLAILSLPAILARLDADEGKLREIADRVGFVHDMKLASAAAIVHIAAILDHGPRLGKSEGQQDKERIQRLEAEVTRLRTAARLVVDDFGPFHRETLPGMKAGYWAPAAAMVQTEYIAALKRVLDGEVATNEASPATGTGLGEEKVN